MVFSLKKVENLRVREKEQEEKGTINSAPKSLKGHNNNKSITYRMGTG